MPWCLVAGVLLHNLIFTQMEESTGETIIHTIVPPHVTHSQGASRHIIVNIHQKLLRILHLLGLALPGYTTLPHKTVRRNMTDTECICRVFVYEPPSVLLEME